MTSNDHRDVFDNKANKRYERITGKKEPERGETWTPFYQEKI